MPRALIVALAVLGLAGCSLLGSASRGLCFKTATTMAPGGGSTAAVPVISETCLTLPGGR